MKQADIQSLLDSGTDADLALVEAYINSPYLQFEPRPDQPDLGDEMTSFIEDQHPGKIILGGTGSAKTRSTSYLFAKQLYTNEPPEPHTPVWVVSQDLDMTGKIWSQALSYYIDKDNIAPNGIRWRKTELYPEMVHMKPNAKGNSWNIEFYSCDQGRKALQAANVWQAWVDEQAPPEIIEEVWGRLRRWHHANMFLLTCTPLNPDKWLQDLWERRDDPEVSNMYRFYRLNSMCNEWLPEEFRRDYFNSLSPDQRLTRQFGDFSNYKGSVFPEFTSDLIIDPFNTENMEQIIGVDFGFHHPAAAWLAKSKNGDYYIIDEEQGHDMMPDALAGRIKRRYDHRHKVYSDYEDIISARILTKCGIHNSPCVGKDVKDSIETMKSLFWQKKLKVFSTCKQTIRQLRGYRWKQWKPDQEEKDVVIKVNDHLVDANRYGIYSSIKRVVRPWHQPACAVPIRLIGKAGMPQFMLPRAKPFDLLNRR